MNKSPIPATSLHYRKGYHPSLPDRKGQILFEADPIPTRDTLTCTFKRLGIIKTLKFQHFSHHQPIVHVDYCDDTGKLKKVRIKCSNEYSQYWTSKN